MAGRETRQRKPGTALERAQRLIEQRNTFQESDLGRRPEQYDSEEFELNESVVQSENPNREENNNYQQIVSNRGEQLDVGEGLVSQYNNIGVSSCPILAQLGPFVFETPANNDNLTNFYNDIVEINQARRMAIEIEGLLDGKRSENDFMTAVLSVFATMFLRIERRPEPAVPLSQVPNSELPNIIATWNRWTLHKPNDPMYIHDPTQYQLDFIKAALRGDEVAGDLWDGLMRDYVEQIFLPNIQTMYSSVDTESGTGMYGSRLIYSYTRSAVSLLAYVQRAKGEPVLRLGQSRVKRNELKTSINNEITNLQNLIRSSGNQGQTFWAIFQPPVQSLIRLIACIDAFYHHCQTLIDAPNTKASVKTAIRRAQTLTNILFFNHARDVIGVDFTSPKEQEEISSMKGVPMREHSLIIILNAVLKSILRGDFTGNGVIIQSVYRAPRAGDPKMRFRDRELDGKQYTVYFRNMGYQGNYSEFNSVAGQSESYVGSDNVNQCCQNMAKQLYECARGYSRDLLMENEEADDFFAVRVDIKLNATITYTGGSTIDVGQQRPQFMNYGDSNVERYARVFNRTRAFNFYIASEILLDDFLYEGNNGNATFSRDCLAQVFHDLVVRTIQVNPSNLTRLNRGGRRGQFGFMKDNDDVNAYKNFLRNAIKTRRYEERRNFNDYADIVEDGDEDDPFNDEEEEERDSGYVDGDMQIRGLLRDQINNGVLSTDVMVDRCSIVVSQTNKLSEMNRYRHVQNMQILRYWSHNMREQHARIRYLPSLSTEWRNAAYMDAALRALQDPEFDSIEKLVPQHSCAVHAYLYLLMIGGVLHFSDMQSFVKSYENSVEFKRISENSDACFALSQNQQLRLIKKDLLEEDGLTEQECEIAVAYASFGSQQAISRNMSRMRIFKHMKGVGFVVQNGHIIPVEACNLKQAVKLLSVGYDIVDVVNKRAMPVFMQHAIAVGCTNASQVKKCEAQLEWDDPSRLQTLDEYQAFFLKYSSTQKVSSTELVLIWYDIETTTTQRLQHNTEKFNMIPYLICCDIQLTTSQGDLIKYCGPHVFEGENCVQDFMDLIDKILMQAHRTKPKRELWLLGWNARKFDSQFIIPEIIKRYVLDFSLTGTPSNPKNFTFGQLGKLLDARDMVGGGSLESFARSMGVRGKDQTRVALGITSLEDWRLSPNREEIIDYCEQDVQAMKNAVWVFNNNTVALLERVRQTTINITGVNPFILKPTIAKLSYDIFRLYLSLPGWEIGVNSEESVYKAVKLSYRGGYVQPFIFGMIVPEPGRRLWYLDVNSLYPSVMCSGRLPTTMNQEVVCCSRSQESIDYKKLVINPLNLYKVESFDLGCVAKFGWFAVPVKVETDTKNVYMQAANIPPDQPLWVWGVELMGLRKSIPIARVQVSKYIQVKQSCMLLRGAALLYQMRLDAKREGKDAEANSMKQKMNNVYGRLGMKCYDQSFFLLSRDQLDCVSQEDYDIIVANKRAELLRAQNQKEQMECLPQLKDVSEDVQLMKYTVLRANSYMPIRPEQKVTHVASYISAKSRTTLLTTLYANDGMFKAIYSDTDSVIIDANDSFNPYVDMKQVDYAGHQPELLTGLGKDQFKSAGCHDTQLGQLKVEYKDIEAVQVFGAKFYRFRVNGKWIVKTKGVFFRGNEEEVEKLRNEKDEWAHEGFEFLQKNLCGMKSDRLFESFSANMSATVDQQYIRKSGKNMVVTSGQKQLGLVLTRYVLNIGGNGHNYTRPFKSVKEFRDYYERNLRWNDRNQRYCYGDLSKKGVELDSEL